ncbi:MAG: sodium:proton antiporter [Planctomycetia bacterium]|nr:sodium:proton antiporter [Planctomycetia bacterium]
MSQDMEKCAHESHEQGTPSAKPVLLGLLAVFVIYLGLAAAGLPQKWSHLVLDGAHHEVTAEDAAAPGPAEQDVPELPAQTDVTDAESVQDEVETSTAATTPSEAEHAAEAEHGSAYPPLWTVFPFCALLLCIAILPLVPCAEHWWESNLHRFYVAAVLGLITLLYYAFMCDFPIDCHWPVHATTSPENGPFAMVWTIILNAIVNDYIPFIVLLFSLFTIAGGIRITGDLKASPFINSVIIAIGAALASFVGTTAAAMLLIRLLIETNKERKYKAHTVIFFIFCVCNCGGCLLPIGDPPLFLGYLRGVSFLWTFSLWKEWLFINGLMILVYFLWDSLWFYRRETPLSKAADKAEYEPLRIHGICPNLFCLIGVVAAVMFLAPGRPIAGFNPWMFLREVVQLLMVAISLFFGSHAIRVNNSFNYAAILEVAALFFGIFICMQAPLQILNANGEKISHMADKYGSKIGLSAPQQFFWMTGSLSSVLDNAPTYAVFFETARAAEASQVASLKAAGQNEEAAKLEASLENAKKVCGVAIPLHLLAAVSLGAVMMGAMTYIGNGPNFMVKAVAEQSGVKMPSFFGYMAYSIILLFPVLLIMTLIFLK